MGYDVNVTVTSWVIPYLVGEAIGISGVQASTVGSSPLIDLVAIEGSLFSATWSMTVCVGSHCLTKTAVQWFPTVPTSIQFSQTNTFELAYVPAGPQHVTVTLSGNGMSSSGSTSVCVGSGGC